MLFEEVLLVFKKLEIVEVVVDLKKKLWSRYVVLM